MPRATDQPKRGRGRPPRTDDAERIKFTLPGQTIEAIRSEAEATGKTQSDVVAEELRRLVRRRRRAEQ